MRCECGGLPILKSVGSESYLVLAAAIFSLVVNTVAVASQAGGITLPTGQTITPTAAVGAIFQNLSPEYPAIPAAYVHGASTVSVSPDGRLLAILTSGNSQPIQHFDKAGKVDPELSSDFIFLFDITGAQPKQLQALPVSESFIGLGWGPLSNILFASGGTDDAILEFVRDGSMFAMARTIPLGHHAGVGIDAPYVRHPAWTDLATVPVAGALAVSPDGRHLLVANFQNDSVSLIDVKLGRVVAEQDLRPGVIDPRHHGEPGGSYPRSVAWISASRAYVGSQRDREVISLETSGNTMRVVRRIPVQGQPVALLANRDGSRLYAALDNTDQVAIFDTSRDTVIEKFNAGAPATAYPKAKRLGGANTNGLALTPDEATLLVTNGGENAVAVVRLGDKARDRTTNHRESEDDEDEKARREPSAVIGLVPTGWYPTGIATSKDGATWYVINAKSETGPNVRWCRKLDPVRNTCLSNISENAPPLFAPNGIRVLRSSNETVFQLERAGFLAMPIPTPLELARLTKQVARNDNFDRPDIEAKDEQLFSFLQAHIHHVIYIVKENRTYDQILGDLEIGNGDPRLAMFPESISPNHHAIARGFVTLDNFLVSGEGSNNGWDFSTAARATDYWAHPGSGDGADWWGANRNINVGYATSAERHAEFSLSPTDPDILPGERDVSAPDGPNGQEGRGYIWDEALRRGISVRNYGSYGHYDHSEVVRAGSAPIPLVRDPFAQKLRVFLPTKASLMPISDPYYRTWNTAFPDYWRYQEWRREFDIFSTSNSLPNLMLVELGNDHAGSFAQAIDGVNTPETQMADNDYALGQIVEAVANSRFAKDTLIISIEDDPCDGPDHVDAFRSVAMFAGPYVRQHSLVSTRYTTISVVKTIEEILGIGPIGLNDALAAPMSDVFDPNQSEWTYKAIVPAVLRSTQLPLPPDDHASVAYPKHSARYWTKSMGGQDFSGPDRIDPASFNRALWHGLKGGTPYPALQSTYRTARNERNEP